MARSPNEHSEIQPSSFNQTQRPNRRNFAVAWAPLGPLLTGYCAAFQSRRSKRAGAAVARVLSLLSSFPTSVTDREGKCAPSR
jgi:hypothetical protein